MYELRIKYESPIYTVKAYDLEGQFLWCESSFNLDEALKTVSDNADKIQNSNTLKGVERTVGKKAILDQLQEDDSSQY